MKNFYRGTLDVSPLVGSSIYYCIREAVKTAKEIDAVIKFRFNDIKFKIDPDANLEIEIAEATRRLHLGREYR
jgi:hypothetical protein